MVRQFFADNVGHAAVFVRDLSKNADSTEEVGEIDDSFYSALVGPLSLHVCSALERV